jgi:hypothetical protein
VFEARETAVESGEGGISERHELAHYERAVLVQPEAAGDVVFVGAPVFFV